MKQKAVVMATAFTMLLAVGVTGLGNEVLHQHPAYANQRLEAASAQTPALSAPENEIFLLAAPSIQEK